MTTHPHLEGLIRKWHGEARAMKQAGDDGYILTNLHADELEAALAALPGGGVATLPVDVRGQWYEVPIPVQLHVIGLRDKVSAADGHPANAVRRALERFVETTQDEGSTDLPRDVLDGLIAFGYMTKRRAGKHGFFYEMTDEGNAALSPTPNPHEADRNG